MNAPSKWKSATMWCPGLNLPKQASQFSPSLLLTHLIHDTTILPSPHLASSPVPSPAGSVSKMYAEREHVSLSTVNTGSVGDHVSSGLPHDFSKEPPSFYSCSQYLSNPSFTQQPDRSLKCGSEFNPPSMTPSDT